MKFKTNDGQVANLHSIHQMMSNPDYEVVEKEETEGFPAEVILWDENGREAKWGRDEGK